MAELVKEHIPAERIRNGDLIMRRIYDGGRGPYRVNGDPRRVTPDDPVYSEAPRAIRVPIEPQAGRSSLVFEPGVYVLKFHRDPGWRTGG